MLGLVLSPTYLQMFVFWELVGLCSYLLIGFWYTRPAAARAALKAFWTTKLGDLGFVAGIVMLWSSTGTFEFEALFRMAKDQTLPVEGLATIMFLIYLGAVGKSAQFPLHVWLPDAMEGPTPVSALIHAATMVAAGVYMLCRVFFLFSVPGSLALDFIAWIGGFTALLAALIAAQQNDIKRILAYSTLSQLGYMVMAVGLRGPAQAMFHLTTHAFFKALLFLAAGSVIYVLHHEQDIWRMGDLRRKMPVTFWTFMAGTLALAGVQPLSGFYSKDGILAQALEHNVPLFVLGAIVAILTTFYMFRLVFVVFSPPARSDTVSHAHESPPVMLWPLRILALFSVIGGFIGIGIGFARFFSGKIETRGTIAAQILGPALESPWALNVGLVAIVAGFAAAW